MAPRFPLIFNPQNGVTESVEREGDIIHKVLRARADTPEQWQPSADPRHWNFWQREALVYQTDLPEKLGLRGPELKTLRVTDAGERFEMRIAAASGRTGADVTIDDLVDLAGQLGRSNAVEHDDEVWLSRGFLSQYIENRAVDWALLDSDAAWAQPLISAAFDDEAREGIVRLRASRPRLLEIAGRLPRTIGHLDVFPANVFVDDDGPLLIDWAFTGDAALGEDIGNLIPDALFDMFQPAEALDELVERLPAAYLGGLRSAGWEGDERLVTLGIMVTGAVKYDWLMPRILERASLATQTTYGGVVLEDPGPNYLARAAGLVLCAHWSEEAQRVAAELGL